jgi:hypothetical protein
MNAKEKSPIARIRTSEVVPMSGIWRNECSREGCRFIEELLLDQGVPAPPCRHCCNRSQLTYRGPAPIAVDQVLVGTITGPRHFTTRRFSARFGDITLTWTRGAPPASLELPAAAAPLPAEEKAAVPGAPRAEEKPALIQRLTGRESPKNAPVARK